MIPRIPLLAGALFSCALASTTNAGDFIAYDNSTGFEGYFADQFTYEIGDQVRLVGGAGVVTEFRFEYFFNGANEAGVGTLQFYAMDGVTYVYGSPMGNPSPIPVPAPGTLLFETEPFSLQNGYHQGIVSDISVSVPEKFVWTLHFAGMPAGTSAGPLFYDGVAIGDIPGGSEDFHWERDPQNPLAWVMVGNSGLVDNFAARVIVTPEPSTLALLLLGIAGIVGKTIRQRRGRSNGLTI